MKRVALGLMALYLVWGSTYLAVRYAIESLPPLGMSGVRFILAGAVVYVALHHHWGEAHPGWRQWLSAALVGLLLMGTGSGLVALAESSISSGQAALLVALVPVWMALWEWVKPGGRFPGLMVVSGLILGTLGVATLVAQPGALNQGSMLVLLSSISWCAGSLLSRSLPQPTNSVLFSAMTMLWGGAFLCLESRLVGESWPLHVSTTSFWAWLYLVVFGSILGMSVYTWLLKVGQPTVVSTYSYVNPLVAVVLSWISGETLPQQLPSAACLIVLGVALISLSKVTVNPGAFLWRLPMVGRPLPGCR